MTNVPLGDEVVIPVIEEVLKWEGDWAVLPVVSRADATQLEGVLTLDDILKAFRRAPSENRT